MASKPHRQAPSRNWEWVSPSAARVVEKAPPSRSGPVLRRVARGLGPLLKRLSAAVGRRLVDRAGRLTRDD